MKHIAMLLAVAVMALSLGALAPTVAHAAASQKSSMRHDQLTAHPRSRPRPHHPGTSPGRRHRVTRPTTPTHGTFVGPRV